jgi:hypothetical protein
VDITASVVTTAIPATSPPVLQSSSEGLSDVLHSHGIGLVGQVTTGQSVDGTPPPPVTGSAVVGHSVVGFGQVTTGQSVDDEPPVTEQSHCSGVVVHSVVGQVTTGHSPGVAPGGLTVIGGSAGEVHSHDSDGAVLSGGGDVGGHSGGGDVGGHSVVGGLVGGGGGFLWITKTVLAIAPSDLYATTVKTSTPGIFAASGSVILIPSFSRFK